LLKIKKMQSEVLLEELKGMTKSNINEIEKLAQLPFNALNYKSSTESWSVLECIEHLNRYGEFYIPEITQRIKDSKHKSVITFKSGLLGGYFSKSMLPKEKLNTMKTFKNMNPNHSKLGIDVLQVFLVQQKDILYLLEEAKKVSLLKTKTAISISKLIKLRLGDTFKVLIYHNLRHIVQAKKIKAICL